MQKGIDAGAANTVLLKVNQIGTISEAFDMIQLAYRNGYGVMPCSSRGEGADIADYCVGINAATVRESGTGPTGNRFLQIEAELGARAKFLGRTGVERAAIPEVRWASRQPVSKEGEWTTPPTRSPR